MRIRSIKPEFYRSTDVDAMDWDTRLVFIGIWSYVDDNGVGIDKLSSIVADLFAHDFSLDPNETLNRVSTALNVLVSGGQIARYEVTGRRYLYVANWESHQRVPNPNKPRYPRPTSGYSDPNETLISSDVETNDSLRTGAVEQWNRGTEEQRKKRPSSSATPKTRQGEPSSFAEFWNHYPRKVNRADAVKAFIKAIKRADSAVVIEAAARMAGDPNLPEPVKIPHASTWLNGDRWNNPPYEPEHNGRATPKQSTSEQRAATGWNIVQRLEADEEVQYLNSVLEIGPTS